MSGQIKKGKIKNKKHQTTHFCLLKTDKSPQKAGLF